eukprot:COSAG01_NODE_39474_length_476_cov_0.543767_1_plen_76_part_10
MGDWGKCLTLVGQKNLKQAEALYGQLGKAARAACHNPSFSLIESHHFSAYKSLTSDVGRSSRYRRTMSSHDRRTVP